jgi:hypothetical protein
MARGYLVFGDIEGKLDMLRVECTRCPREGRYSVAGLIEKHGRDGRMMEWREQLNGDCPRLGIERHGSDNPIIVQCIDGIAVTAELSPGSRSVLSFKLVRNNQQMINNDLVIIFRCPP